MEVPLKTLDVKESEETVSFNDIKTIRKDTKRFSVVYLEDALCVIGGDKMVSLGIPESLADKEEIETLVTILDDALQAVQFDIYKAKHPKTKKTVEDFFN